MRSCAQIVESQVWDREVGGSNPLAPILQISNLEAVTLTAFLLIPAFIPAIHTLHSHIQFIFGLECSLAR